ncbi:MAG: GNAT family N-acetyltransferase [Planctomycetes bacterium]|jgi:GNAT superfamily N-acetyltransferase|nr:GNAT family N-acetyltransferase [Planctomycetota bacterium]
MPDEVQIRIAGPEDVDTIAELNIAMAWETERRQLHPATIRRGVRAVTEDADYGFYVVAENAGAVVGCLMITYEWSDWRSALFWWIQSLYVRPAFRHHGVFKQLHEFVRARALQDPRVCGLRLYVEQANHVAQNAYDRVGMRPTTYRMYEEALQCPDVPPGA